MQTKILLIILAVVVLGSIGVLIWGFGDSMPDFTGSETPEEEISNEITPREKITAEEEPALSDTLNLCKKINQPCQSYGQGVGGGDNCCEGLKCDGSGPDGTTGVCEKEGCEGQPCRSFSQGVGGGDDCCEEYRCDGSGPDGTTGKCIKLK